MKKMLFALCLIILPIFSVFAGCNASTPEIELRVTGEYVQWSYVGDNTWHDVVSIEDIKTALGETYKGDKGDTGPQGQAGINGREVEFRANETHLQWHYAGETTWYDLVELSKINIDTTTDSNPQQLDFYPLDDGTYGVGVGKATQLSSITIPTSYNSKSITKIVDSGFATCSNLKEITIPNSVTSIGGGAFSGCSSLTSITIPSSVTSIGNSAFSGCSSLTIITIPNSVTSIGRYAFEGCSGLTSITIPNSVTSIGDYAFRYCSNLTNVAFESGSKLTSIGNSAFNGCSGLTSITIPNSVTSIGNSAFYNCSSLTSITIPSSVTSIGNSAFYGCSSLQEMTLPFVGGSKKTSTDTYQYPFGYIFGTSSYTGSKATDQYYYEISTSSNTYTTYYIPTSLKKVIITGGNILHGAFYNCSSLISIIIPSSVTSIGVGAFDDCSSLESITIPNSVTSIGGSAFSGCSSLTSITIPNSVTSIGGWAFSGCSSLTSITIPNSVTSIGYFAFGGCSGLSSVTFENSNGWKAGSTSLSSGDLSDKSTAATYLKYTYISCNWIRD